MFLGFVIIPERGAQGILILIFPDQGLIHDDGAFSVGWELLGEIAAFLQGYLECFKRILIDLEY
jgi:hypothetical protein